MTEPHAENFFAKEVEELRNLQQEFRAQVLLVCLEGDLGAGKTTFVQEFLRSYSPWYAEVQSPTFLKLLEYEILNLGLVLHIDAYRMEDENEIEKLSLESYEDPAVVFVEWPNLFKSYFAKTTTLKRLWGVRESISIRIEEGLKPSERSVSFDRVRL